MGIAAVPLMAIAAAGAAPSNDVVPVVGALARSMILARLPASTTPVPTPVRLCDAPLFGPAAANAGDALPACFHLSARHAVGADRTPAVAGWSGHRDEPGTVLRIAGTTLPAARMLMGWGGVALTGRLALAKGAPIRLSVDSLTDPRPGAGYYYDQWQAGAINERTPGHAGAF